MQALSKGEAAEQIVMDAIKYHLVAIGEAATHLSDELRGAHSDIDWAAIKGLRNILAHEYFRVSHGLIRDVAEGHVPDLAERASEILEGL